MNRKFINIILIISIIFCFNFYITHLNHDCTHNDCLICNIIKQINRDLNGYKPTVFIVTSLFMLLLPIIVYIKEIINDRKRYTLIELNVELNN